MTNPANASVARHDRQTHYWCVDPATQLFNCNPETNPGGNDNTAQALFRAWIIVPDGMDGSQYDEQARAMARSPSTATPTATATS